MTENLSFGEEFHLTFATHQDHRADKPDEAGNYMFACITKGGVNLVEIWGILDRPETAVVKVGTTDDSVAVELLAIGAEVCLVNHPKSLRLIRSALRHWHTRFYQAVNGIVASVEIDKEVQKLREQIDLLIHVVERLSRTRSI